MPSKSRAERELEDFDQIFKGLAHPSRRHTVSSDDVSDDGGSNFLSGFSIVKADSMDAALEMAKGCPHLEHGTIEVAEVKELKLQK